MLTSEELYKHNVLNADLSYVNGENDDYQNSDYLDDDTNSYSEENFTNLYTISAGEDRRPFYEPTTSRQADEEDQHVELFHKNILVFPTSREQNQDTVPSCSYGYNDEPCSPYGYDMASTGFTQSDLTGSSSSTSRRARTDYAYGNQCEYVSSEFSRRKRSSSLKILTSDEKKTILGESAMFQRAGTSISPEESVLQVTDCSSPEFSEPSK